MSITLLLLAFSLVFVTLPGYGVLGGTSGLHKADEMFDIPTSGESHAMVYFPAIKTLQTQVYPQHS